MVEQLSIIVTALATIVLAAVTYVLARETKRLADVGERPNVLVTFEPNRHTIIYLDMIVQNVGTAPAYEIEIEFDPILEFDSSMTSRLSPPIEKISLLKPQQELSSGFVGWNELKTKEFVTKISWKKSPDAKGREALLYHTNLNLLEGISRLGEEPQIEIANSIKKIADEIKNVGTNSRRISANIFDARDREEERKQMEEMIEKRRKRRSGEAETG